ncbi:bifunctional 2-polyprenyl-6-hydroxyphenol methylase/3-demethylubiquinol 3-O-methyltransferase UbiG [Marinobacterium sp. xm-d-564]|uniref:class I SAM-dependent methyltransferase n=1 Tax=Marinobacterium sp. xm-d-564 TaxID=2497742 RepID=UPI001569AE22|nr:class I SAM-dependent methyltransferase [Marinobacterium sp. xm-d-564]NRP60354.1 hypothetical protein [Marinobacterium sp. xm-d-564]
MNQSEIFKTGEGDAWFDRNKSALELGGKSVDTQFIEETLKYFHEEINSILEIGCADGRKLEALCESFAARGVGIDPSKKAIDSGLARTKRSLDLKVGTLEDVELNDGQFDMVFFGFCLYLIPRDKLQEMLAKADKLIRDGGFLIITDFDPLKSIVNKYSHADDVFSYKEDYGRYFIEKGYFLIEKHSFSHYSDSFSKDSNERVSVQILFKG